MQRFVKKNLKFVKDIKYRKVGDHCHYTNGYRGAAHSIGNLKYSVSKEIPIVFTINLIIIIILS